MKLNEFISLFNSVRRINSTQYMVTCPCHNDKKESLSITQKDNRILLYCFAGCPTKDIVNNIGISMSDLFIKEKEKKMEVIEKEYIYTDENGHTLYKAIKYRNLCDNSKRFQLAQFHNNKWIYNMQNARRVLYNLHNVVKSKVIYFVEGEKDADNLNKIGLIATTSANGASGFNRYATEYVESLKNKIVYIIPDNDIPGQKYAKSVYNALYEVAQKVQILNLADEIKNLNEKEDISDVIEKYGKERALEVLENLKKKEIDNKNFPIKNADELNEITFEKILSYLNITIKYNVITKRIAITGMPEKYSISDLENIITIYLKEILRKYGIKINNTKKIEELLILHLSKNNFNPILELLDNNKWDNINRYGEICNIFNLNEEFDKILLIKWLRQSVAMLLNNLKEPFGAEGILTLQGKQGIGKSWVLSQLAMNPEWFADGVVIDMKQKDSLIKATSRWICELGEVDDTIKKEQSSLKAFVTSPEDDIRNPYAKTSTRRPRNTSFCASVNIIPFLKDDENRRFWVINVKKINCQKLKKLGTEWILQLWLQAYEDIKKDINSFRLADEEKLQLKESNLKFTEFLPYEEDLMNMIDFNPVSKTRWCNQELIDTFFPNATFQSIGKVLNKIENNYPNAITIKRNNKGMIYFMKIKDEFLKNKKK